MHHFITMQPALEDLQIDLPLNKNHEMWSRLFHSVSGFITVLYLPVRLDKDNTLEILLSIYSGLTGALKDFFH